MVVLQDIIIPISRKVRNILQWINVKANVLAFTKNLRTNSPSCAVRHQDTAPFYTDLTLSYSIIIAERHIILCTVIGGDEISMLLYLSVIM